MKKAGYLAVSVLILPLLLCRDVYFSVRDGGKKVLYIIVVLLFLGSTWFQAYAQLYRYVRDSVYPKSKNQIEKQVFKEDKGTPVHVIGASMLPTITSGSDLTIFDPVMQGVGRFDIVSLKNKQTNGSHYMKRIIGIPNDAFAIKNGYVEINGKILKEPYTLHSLPTYGNAFLSDCVAYTVPADSYVVMGDNRTVSYDSRVIGFIRKDEIEGVIKTKVVEEYASDTEKTQILKKTINPAALVAALNKERNASVSGVLKLSTRLNGVAVKRSAKVRDNFDDWKKLSIPVDETLASEKYAFNLAHEYVTFGYLDEQQLVDQIMDSLVEKDDFLSGKFTDIGVGVSERTIDACTYPVISVILSWPSAPDYPQSTINSWKKEIQVTKDNMDYLQGLVGISYYDQTKLRRYITVEAEMNSIATQLYNRTRSNTWFTPADSAAFDKHEKLVDEAWALDKELFKQNYDANGNRKQ